MTNSHSTNTTARSRLNAGPQRAASGLPSSMLWVVCCEKVRPRENGTPLVSLRLLAAEKDFFFSFFFFFFAQWAISLPTHVQTIMPVFFFNPHRMG